MSFPSRARPPLLVALLSVALFATGALAQQASEKPAPSSLTVIAYSAGSAITAFAAGVATVMKRLKKDAQETRASVVAPPGQGPRDEAGESRPVWKAVEDIRRNQAALFDSVNGGFEDIRDRVGRAADRDTKLEARIDQLGREQAEGMGQLRGMIEGMAVDQKLVKSLLSSHERRFGDVDRAIANLERAVGLTRRADSGSAIPRPSGAITP